MHPSDSSLSSSINPDVCTDQALDLPLTEEQALRVENAKLRSRVAELEAQLRHAEACSQLVMEATHDGTFDVDLVTGVTRWSPRWLAIFGYGPGDVIDSREWWLNTIHPDDRDRIAAVNDALLGGEVPHFVEEYRLRCQDGSYKWVLDNSLVICDAAGQPMRIVGGMRDISDRKQTELALQKSQTRFAAILDIASDAIIAINEQQQITLFNQGAEAIFGYTAAEVLGHPLDILLPQRFIGPHRSHVHQFDRSQNRTARRMAERGEVFGRRKDGTEFPAEASISRLEIGGEVIFTAILRDISDRKQVEQQLRTKAEQERALNRVVQMIRNSLELDTIFATATQEMTQLLQIEQTNIIQYLPERQCWRILVSAQLGDAIPSSVGVEIPDINNPLSERLKRGEIIRIDQTSSIDDPLNQRMAERFPGSWLLIPLMVGETIWGCLGQLAQRENFYWTEEQVELSEAVASQLAIAIQQAQLFQQVQHLNQVLAQRVQEQTTQLQLALAAAHMGVWEVDCATGREYWSPEVYAMLGFCSDAQGRVLDQQGREVVPYPTVSFYWSRVHPEDRAHIQNLQAEARQQRTFCEDERRVMMPDGSYRWHLSRASYLYDEAGNAVKLIGISMDVSDRKAADEALREREDLFRSIFQHSPTPIGLMRLADQAIVKVNSAWLDLLGYSAAELPGLTLADITTPEDLALDQQQMQLLLTGQATCCQMEKHLVKKTGEPVWVNLTVSLLRDANGTPIYSLGISEDITERKRVEQELRASLAEKEVLLQEIHHRVKNNLQIVSSLMRLQMGRVEDQRITRLIQETQHRIQSMALIHEQLYQSSNFAQIDFGDYVCKLVQTLLRSYGVSPSLIHTTVETNNIALKLDLAIPCGLIINELVSNALKYAFPNHQAGTITIRLRPSTTAVDRVILVIADDGIGMPAGFDWKTSESLGLQIVYGLVHQLRGTLTLDTQDTQRGTRFEIELPLAE